uniref:E3 ubiquitin-protein ligase RING1-like n=1 Tax=Anthurium amnicola TaxID=1678845 RepID=A0A1D1ZF95_9ARAE
MGDYFLSPAEIDAVWMSREAGRRELLPLLPGSWAADGAAPTALGRPRLEIVPETLDMRTLLQLLPGELFNPRYTRGRGGGDGASPEEDFLPNPEHLPSLMELLEPETALSIHHFQVRIEEVFARPPRPREALERLEKVVVGDGVECDRCCPICLDEMEVGSEARAMGCSHRYHEACLFEWLRRKSSCPLCRYQMPVG